MDTYMYVKLIRGDNITNLVHFMVPTEPCQNALWLMSPNDCVAIVRGRLNSAPVLDAIDIRIEQSKKK